MLALWVLLLALGLALLLLLLTRRPAAWRGGRGRPPPGPRGLPVLGSLLSLDPRAPHESLARLARCYGPVCGLRLGSVYAVLVTEPRLVRQLFARDCCSGRAPLYLTHGIMKGYGLIAAQGDLWKEQRKFVAGRLKSLGMVKFSCPKRDELERTIVGAAEEALQKLEIQTGEKGIDPHNILHHCIGNLMNFLVFGKVYDEDDELWKWLQLIQEEGVKYVGVSGPINFLPFLRFIPYYGRTLKLIVDGQRKTHEVYRRILEDHRRQCPSEASSFLAAYDEEMKRRVASGEPLGSFTETQCFYLLADIYGAGVDTTLTTLRWFLLFMAAFPDEQDKIQEEMDRVVGERKPTLEDRQMLLKLEAAIMEVQRIRSTVPTGIPHGTTEETQIDGYDIPEGSMIMPVQWAIHLNPEYWPDPLIFKPDRFIGEDGGLTKPDAFLPFQFGKRMCVGDELARMILFLFSARALHRFSVSAPAGEAVDLEGDCGITLIPKPQSLIWKRRR